MRKQIYIAPNGTIDTDDYFELDLIEEARLPITYQIADIREPDKRKTSHSKTITLPGTANNNKIFGNIFEIGIDGSFNPNLKSEVIMLSDTEPVFTGFLLLKKVIISNQNIVGYEAEIYGELKNLFTNLSDKKFSDLNLSEYDHLYRKQVIRDSWNADVYINGVLTNRTLGTDNEGYVYPLIDYGTAILADEDFAVKDFFPAIYFRTLIDKIFALAGFTFDSDFFDSAFFRKLILPCSNPVLLISKEDADNNSLSARVDDAFADGVTNIPLDTDTLLTFSVENSDPSNQWNGTRFTATRAGNYSMRPRIHAVFGAGTNSVQCFLRSYKNGAYNSTSSAITATGDLVFIDGEDTVFLAIGDYVEFYARKETTGGAKQIDVNTANLDSSAFPEDAGEKPFVEIILLPEVFVEGQLIKMSDVLPKEIKCADFFIWIIKRFNLYVFEDKTNPTNLFIEPRDKTTIDAETFDGFYTGEVLDWSDKLDAELIELELTNELAAKNYLFTDEEDGDYYNQRYKKSWFNSLGKNSIFGDKVIENNNDFLKNTKETKTGFAPTPSADSINSTQKIIPAIFKANEDGTGRATMASKPRILTYQGLRALVADNWTFVSALDGNSAESSYPYAGHLDDPQDPTFDLNFGLVREVFYTDNDGILTNNNIYELFHKTFIEQIIDKDAKILVGKFRLTTKDIRELDFRKTIFCAGAYFLLNKISDFDLDNDELASVELIKIK